MKTLSFGEILSAWVGNRRLLECSELLDVADTTLCDWMKGNCVPWDRAIRRMAPVMRMKPERLIAVAARDRKLGDRRKRSALRKRRVNRPAKTAAA